MKTLALAPIAEEIDIEKTWLSLKEGEEKALELIYLNFSKPLFQLGISLTQDPDFTEDCIQELFIDIWKYRKNLKCTDNVRIYLFRSMTNKIYKEKRKVNKRTKENLQVKHETPLTTESIEIKLVNLQQEETLQLRLASALKKLPARQNEVIQYLFFENFSYEEIAKLMGINLRSVYTLAWKAISSLKKHL